MVINSFIIKSYCNKFIACFSISNYNKKADFRYVIATVLILASVYLILALLSELSEFIEFNDDAKELAIFGVLYLGLNITFGAIMLYRYAIKNEIKQTEIIHNN